VAPDLGRPVRVVYLTHVARLSGAEIGLLRLVGATRSVEATVLLAEDGPLAGALREAGAQVEVLPLREDARDLRRTEVRPGVHALRAGTEVLRYAGRVARRVRELDPDLLHAGSLKAGIYGSLAARLTRRPLVWQLADQLSPDYLPAAVVPSMRAVVSVAPSGLVVPSRATLTATGRHFRPGLRTAVVPFPVPIPETPIEPREALGVVGIVGRLTPWKGQHVFLEGFAQAFPDGSQRAHIIGSAMFGEEDYGDELVALAHRLGIGDRVEFRGFRSDVEAELRGLDALVHASTSAEPFGMVVPEGMAAGLPVVASRAGGPAEYLEEGRTGLLYPPGDAGALAAALRRLADDRDLRVRLGRDGREKAREYAPALVAAQMEDFYARVLGR